MLPGRRPAANPGKGDLFGGRREIEAGHEIGLPVVLVDCNIIRFFFYTFTLFFLFIYFYHKVMQFLRVKRNKDHRIN